MNKWVPRTAGGTVVYSVLFAVVALPAAVGYFLAVMFAHDCVTATCHPGAVAWPGGYAVVLTGVPFAGVRVFQSTWPVAVRLAIVAAAVGAVVYPMTMIT